MKYKFMTPVKTPVGRGTVFAEAEKKPGEVGVMYAVIMRKKDFLPDEWLKICPSNGPSKLLFFSETELSVINLIGAK